MPLATIEIVKSVRPIANADNIELIHVLGYRTVVKKGEFAVGDQCVFIKPDTVVEPRPIYEFLAAQDYRVKVARFRGEYSLGLAMPLLSVLPLGAYHAGQDVTEAAGVSKYEKPLPEDSEAIGGFPSIITKTDEQDLRGTPEALAEFYGKHVYATIKLDGTSATYQIDEEGKFRIYSRRYEVGPGNIYGRMAAKYGIEEHMRDFSQLAGPIAVQGEIYGPKVNGNKGKFPEQAFALFGVYSLSEHRNKALSTLEVFSGGSGIPMVPKIFEYQEMPELTMEELVAIANDLKYSTGAKAEGFVLRTVRDVFRSEHLPYARLSGKILSEAFLVKHGE